MGLDYIRSVILDWRKESAREICWKDLQVTQSKEETRWPLKRRGRSAGHSRKPVGSPLCVLRPLHYFTKRGPRHRRKIWANSLWLYPYFTQTSPSKNKNINYIFISTSSSLFVQRCNIRQYINAEREKFLRVLCFPVDLHFQNWSTSIPSRGLSQEERMATERERIESVISARFYDDAVLGNAVAKVSRFWLSVSCKSDYFNKILFEYLLWHDITTALSTKLRTLWLYL